MITVIAQLVVLALGVAFGLVLHDVWRWLWPREREVFMVCDVDNRTCAVFTNDAEAKICAGAGNLDSRYPGPYYVYPCALDPEQVELAGGAIFQARGAAQRTIDQADAERRAAVKAEAVAEVELARPAVVRRAMEQDLAAGHQHKHAVAAIPVAPSGACRNAEIRAAVSEEEIRLALLRDGES